MAAFGWLKKAVEQHQQDGCETSSEAENFVNDYGRQVEVSKRSLKERQERERKERSSESDS